MVVRCSLVIGIRASGLGRSCIFSSNPLDKADDDQNRTPFREAVDDYRRLVGDVKRGPIAAVRGDLATARLCMDDVECDSTLQ